MKKLFDKYLFSRLGMQLGASIAIVLAFTLIAALMRNDLDCGFFQRLIWGFKQVSSPSVPISTIDTLAGETTHVQGAVPIYVLALTAWVISLAVYSFITGFIVNWFRNRKHLIDEGMVFYSFKDHGIVIGWDFQGASCVKNLLADKGCGEVLIVSTVSAKTIRNELKVHLSRNDLSRVYIYNGLITSGRRLIANACPESSRFIVILGERNGADNDGGNLHIERFLRNYLEDLRKSGVRWPEPIKVYLHIEDSLLYTQARAMEKGGLSESDKIIDLEVFNFYESWAWRCWSLKGACDGDRDGELASHEGDEYLPLRHKRDAERIELFVIGSSLMGQAMVNYAMPLMNYGEDRKHCKITIFDDSRNGGVFLPEKWVLDALPEVEVEYVQLSGGSDAANDRMIAAASNPKTAVTVVIATPGADAAVKAYAQLAYTLRRMKDVSILVWQSTTTGKCPRKPFLQTGGDCCSLRFFGMTDRLPWMNPVRQEGGMSVNFFYDVIFKELDNVIPVEPLPEARDDRLLAVAAADWEKGHGVAKTRWLTLPRWKKWSSINSGDSFKEKAFAFPDCATNMDARWTLLHAEHNRWWTERLLAGWKPCEKPNDPDKGKRKEKEKALKAEFLHWDVVPFADLDDDTKDLDKVSVVAMKACGFLG